MAAMKWYRIVRDANSYLGVPLRLSFDVKGYSLDDAHQRLSANQLMDCWPEYRTVTAYIHKPHRQAKLDETYDGYDGRLVFQVNCARPAAAADPV